ncbi:hypothetical protein A2U01_0037942, partial [Trifolium medium]|nr:hypothetical protein [Trifolium medium]
VAGSSPCCVALCSLGLLSGCHSLPCAGSVAMFGWFDLIEYLMPAVFYRRGLLVREPVRVDGRLIRRFEL